MTMWNKIKALFADNPAPHAPPKGEEKPGVKLIRSPAGTLLELHPDGSVVDVAETKRIARAYRDDTIRLRELNLRRIAEGKPPLAELPKDDTPHVPREYTNI